MQKKKIVMSLEFRTYGTHAQTDFASYSGMQ